MTNLWTYSPSSECYLHRCLAAAQPPDPNNPWFIKFGKRPIGTESIHHDITQEQTIILDANKHEAINFDDFFETLTSESTIPVDYVIEECTKNPELITKMAENLSEASVKCLFKDMFSKVDVESKYLVFITCFLPKYFKLNNSRLCTDLIAKSSENQNIFKLLIEILLNDLEIPNQILNNYIAVLNEESATNFMKIISTVKVSQEGFLQNILSIYTAYKSSYKDELLQEYTKHLIYRHNLTCAADRNFGRLILLFLQTEKCLGQGLDLKSIEECIENHNSPFKRPCYNLLREITGSG